jgi:hypothetical protein
VPFIAELLEFLVRDQLAACEWHPKNVSEWIAPRAASVVHDIPSPIFVTIRIGPPPKKLIAFKIVRIPNVDTDLLDRHIVSQQGLVPRNKPLVPRNKPHGYDRTGRHDAKLKSAKRGSEIIHPLVASHGSLIDVIIVQLRNRTPQMAEGVWTVKVSEEAFALQHAPDLD